MKKSEQEIAIEPSNKTITVATWCSLIF
jgi:hypothetical protein